MSRSRKGLASSRFALLLAFAFAAPAVAQLTAEGGLYLEQNGGGLPHVPAAGDRFGATAAAGDFDGDGRDDLAVGVPGKTIGATALAGLVMVYYGAAGGLDVGLLTSWDVGDFGGIGFTPGNGDRFGSALAAGDFDDDGHDDLAIAAPFAMVERADGTTHDGAGTVFVVYGSPSGLANAGMQAWRQGHDGLAGLPEVDDRLGAALAAGDVDGDGYDDLAIGVPYEDVGEVADAGGLNLLRGSAAGLTASYAGEQVWTKGSFGLQEEEDAHFAAALAFGDFRFDGADDLAIGIPGEDLGGATNGGAVVVAQGTPLSGLDSSDDLLLLQNFFPLPGGAGPGHRFGEALVAADFDGDLVDDLAIGSPGERWPDGAGGELFDVGAVSIVRGSAETGLPGGGLGTRIDRADLGDPANLDSFGSALAAGDFDGDGARELVVGAPGASADAVVGAGAAFVITRPDESALTSTVELVQSDIAPGVAHTWDAFGSSFAVGDFDGSHYADLVVGAPNEDAGALGNAGAASLYSSLVLFRDGFESGNVGPWSGAVGD
jgi:hypothetical protein